MELCKRRILIEVFGESFEEFSGNRDGDAIKRIRNSFPFFSFFLFFPRIHGRNEALF